MLAIIGDAESTVLFGLPFAALAAPFARTFATSYQEPMAKKLLALLLLQARQEKATT